MDTKILEGYYYSKEHEWAKITKNKARIGITDYAQQKLGDITFVDLPEIGKEVSQFEFLAGIESVKAATDIYSPLSGVITAVNIKLEDEPEIINQSPYKEGWIAEIEFEDEGETENLMDSKAYEKHVDGLD